MVLRTRQTNNQMGRVSELMAMSTFAAECADVAIPVGISTTWDFLVCLDKEWKRVQVKTAKPLNSKDRAYCTLRRHKHNRESRYTQDSFDILVVVVPETGDMWKVSIAELDFTKDGLALHADYRWKVGHRTLPTQGVDVYVESSLSHLAPTVFTSSNSYNIIRNALKNSLPQMTKPVELSESNWELLCKHVIDGISIPQITKMIGLRDVKNVTRRLTRSAIICGAELPESYKRLNDIRKVIIPDGSRVGQPVFNPTKVS